MDNCGNITKPKARVYNYLAKLGLLKELPKTISDDTVFFPRNFLLNDKKGYLFTTSEGNIVFEPGKKTPMTWETFVNKDLIASLFKTYGMVLPEDTKIVEFVYPAEGKTKYIDSYVKFNEDILSRIKRFGYEYPQELVPPQMEESNKLEPDDFTEQNSPDLSLEKQPTTTEEIKPGVEELFESNPELANQVYEALGFRTKTSENQITRNIKETLPFKVIGNYDDIEEGLIGRKVYEETIDGDVYKFEISNYNYENEDGTYQSFYDIDFTVNGSEELVGSGFFNKAEKAKQIIQALLSQNFGNDTVRFNVEESAKGKQRLNLYKRLMSQLGYLPSNEMEYALFYENINSQDKIIFGHPTIGKSYLKKQGEDKFITLDDDYADEVNIFVDKNRGSETRQEYKGRKPKEYNEFMLALYDRLKKQAAKEGKILFVSNTNILKERMSDFDKVINIPKDEFKKRFDARGATYGFEDWKSDIDATIAKVPSNKIINTTGYLSDLFKVSSQSVNLTPQQKQQALQLYSQYLDTIFPNSQVKDIVYHGGKVNKESFKRFVDKTKYEDRNPNSSLGFFFSSSKNTVAGQYAEKDYDAIKDQLTGDAETDSFIRRSAPLKKGSVSEELLNIKKPYIIQAEEWENETWVDTLNILSEKDKDSNWVSDYKWTVDAYEKVKNYLQSLGYDGLYINSNKELFNKTGIVDYITVQKVVFEPEQIHILGNKQDIEGFKEFVSGETTKKEAFPYYEMSAEEREQRFQDFYNQNQNISEEDAREYFNRCMI